MADLGGGDGRKSSQAMLSFRSRKLLRGSLSKNAVVEKKRADARNPRELFQPDTLQKESTSGTRSKAERELWNPRKVESEAALAKVESEAAKARASARKARKKQLVQGKEVGIDQVSSPQEQLPQKYKLLETFYEGLEVANSLLRIRRQMCTLRAVCKIVESISKRRFLPKYLAQMKHIFPEVLQLEYVRCKDPDTWNEKWDLRITLLPISSDAALSNSPLKGSPGHSTQTVRRRKEFHSRILQFATTHPESGDIPEDPLPQRPLGGNIPASPPLANRKINTGAGLRSNLAVEAPADLDGADYSFKLAVPVERDYDSVKLPGTPHFPTSFRPFFSVRHSGDGLSTQNPLQHRDELEPVGDIDEAVPEAGELEGTPHFPASFKPHFSVRRPADTPHDALCSETSGHDVRQLQQPVDDEEAESEAGSSAKVDSDAKLFDGTLHFPASFRPFFSNRPAADATDGGSVQSSRDLQPDVCGRSASPCVANRADVEAACEIHPGSSSRSDDNTLLPEGTPHFPGFRSPFFSVRRTGDAADGGSLQFWKTFRPDEVRGCEDAQETESSPGDMHPPKSVPPKFVSPATSSSPVDHPSFRSVFSLSTSSQPTPSPSPQGTPKLKHPNPAASPIPTHTPASLSPMISYRTAQETPVGMVSKSSSADSFVDTPPPKSQGIMRSLKFGSPVSATRPASLVDHDRALKSSVPSTPLKSSLTDKSGVSNHAVVSASVSSSTPASAIPGNVIQASPFSPPTPAGNALHYNPSLLSPVKNSKSRSLQFNSPTKEIFRNDLTPGQGRLHSTRPPLSGAVVKPPQVASSQNAVLSSSPQTPALRSPVKAPRGKETLNSPPKRTKLNRLSLFGKEGDQSQKSRSPTVTEIGGAHTDSNAAEGSLAGQCVSGPICEQDTSVKPKLIPTLAAKDMRRMSASDLDILQNLPVDLVQSVLENEKKLSVEATMELAKQKRRQQMMCGVPKLFNQLRLIFQSLNRSVLPRNELIKSILTSHPDITDRGEVEERLQLLVELVPEYMTTRSSHSGELLYRIDKRADVVQIQRRLSAGV